MTDRTSIPASAVPLLSLAAFASGVSMRVSDPLLPLLSTEFSVPLGQASLVITFFSVAYGLAQLCFGPLGDRYGKYFVVGLAALASAATATLCAAAGSLDTLLAMRLVAGTTAAAIIPLSMAWIGDVIPYERRQPVLARFMIGQILGLSSGVLLGGLAADAHQWRLPFVMVAVVFLVVGVGLLRLNRRLPAHAKALRKVEGSAVRHMLSEFGHIAALPWARLVLLTVFLEGALLYGPFAFIATHLHHAHGVSLALAGAVLMLFGFGGFAFAVASAPMVRRLGEATKRPLPRQPRRRWTATTPRTCLRVARCLSSSASSPAAAWRATWPRSRWHGRICACSTSRPRKRVTSASPRPTRAALPFSLRG